MELKELEELREFNELDLLYKMYDIMELAKPRVEKVLRGNDAAGIDTRKHMQEIKLLSSIIREKVQVRREKIKSKTGNYKGEVVELSKLEKYIVDKKISIIKEDERINRAENFRREKRKNNNGQ